MSMALQGFIIMYGLVMTIAWLAAKGRAIQAKKRTEQLESLSKSCSCGHGYSFHSDDGRCHCSVKVRKSASSFGETVKYDATNQCGCQRYDGPPSMYGVL